MSYHARRILTPGPSRKRKEMEASTSAKPLIPQTSVSRGVSGTNEATTSEAHPITSNRLLAGYMAYEFLTKGTLFGQNFDPVRAEAMPVSMAEPKRNRPVKEAEPSGKSKPQSYAEVANIMKSDAVHIPGVVNPTQLARWIQM